MTERERPSSEELEAQDEEADLEETSGTGGLEDQAAMGEDRATLEEEADTAADFVEDLLSYMGVDAIAEPSERSGHLYVDVMDGTDEDMALLIGRHGQTLDALQELTRTVVSRKLDRRVRVIVDVQDYRKRREERLAQDAEAAAARALDEGEEIEMPPMNAYERKVVHDAVAAIDGVDSFSRGEEPNRFVVVAPE